MEPFPDVLSLSGPFKPMRFEADVDDCIVRGEIPKDLNGVIHRNGPTLKRNQRQGCTGWGVHDAMIQSMVFENGKAHFKNRWIRTPRFVLEEQQGRSVFEYADAEPGWWSYGMGEPVRNELTKGVPSGSPWVNTVTLPNKSVLAVGEINSVPYAFDPLSLETFGPVEWADKCGPGLIEKCTELDGTFCPHPKVDRETGELFGWSATDRPPFCKVIKVTADGDVKTRDLDCSEQLWEANLHDAWLTQDYLVFAFQPFINHRDRGVNHLPLLGWDDNKSVTLVFVPRSLEGKITVIHADEYPGCQNHTMNANTKNGLIMLDAVYHKKAPFPFEQDVGPDGIFNPLPTGHLGRWTVDINKGTIKPEQLSDRLCELPQIDERYIGKNYSWGFTLGGPSLILMNTLIKQNVNTGAEDVYVRESEMPISMLEGHFVPRSADAPEADGYYIQPVCKFAENSSEYLIFDTTSISSGPIAEIELPFQIGWTPHSSYVNFN